jgi:hypothetical protein
MVLATLTLGVLTTLTDVVGGPAASAVHESPAEPSNDRIAVNTISRFLIVLLTYWFVLARWGFSPLGSPKRPFTERGLRLFVDGQDTDFALSVGLAISALLHLSVQGDLIHFLDV